MSGLPGRAQVWWFTVVVMGAVFVAGATIAALANGPRIGLGTAIPVLALGALCILAERMSVSLVTLDSGSASLSIGSVTAVAAVLILPWYLAVPVTAVGVGLGRLNQPPVRTLFNAALIALSVGGAAIPFAILGGSAVLDGFSARALLAIAVVTLAYYGSTSILGSTMLALASAQRVWRVYRAVHMRIALQEATAVGLGLMLGAFWLFNPTFAPLVALPVIMAYFSIDTFVRIQQETRDAVLAMSESIDHRDPLTYNHSKRVATLSVALARELDLSHEQVTTIELSALVHDIGKIGIPSEILMKPGKLTAEERAQMELHPIIGFDMLRHYKQFRKGLGIVRWHHETWDGTGYPDRIAGTHIPIEARIVCIADAFEAMTADRPYRKAMGSDIAYQRLQQAAGTQFDPNLVAAFGRACETIGEIASQGQRSERTSEQVAPAPPSTPAPVAASRPHHPPYHPPRAGALRRLPASASRCRHDAMARTEADA